MTLLREIQNDLANATVDVASVLMKCKILAVRLGSAELSQWLDHELNGYPQAQTLPGYRMLPVVHYASFVSVAWKAERQVIPLQAVPENYREAFRTLKFRDGIAKAASFAREKRGAMVPRQELSFALQGIMYPDMHCYSVWGEIGRTDFEQLLSAVRNRILDFVLKIEAENPDAGEAQINSHPVPVEKLQPLVQNTFYGAVGNVAQHSEHFKQTASTAADPIVLRKLVNELTSNLDELNLDARQRQRAEAQIATINAELAGPDPDPVILAQAGRSLRNITEGAIGSLIATAAMNPSVWQWVMHTLGNF
jgi:hypothetical protein